MFRVFFINAYYFRDVIHAFKNYVDYNASKRDRESSSIRMTVTKERIVFDYLDDYMWMTFTFLSSSHDGLFRPMTSKTPETSRFFMHEISFFGIGTVTLSIGLPEFLDFLKTCREDDQLILKQEPDEGQLRYDQLIHLRLEGRESHLFNETTLLMVETAEDELRSLDASPIVEVSLSSYQFKTMIETFKKSTYRPFNVQITISSKTISFEMDVEKLDDDPPFPSFTLAFGDGFPASSGSQKYISTILEMAGIKTYSAIIGYSALQRSLFAQRFGKIVHLTFHQKSGATDDVGFILEIRYIPKVSVDTGVASVFIVSQSQNISE